MHAALVSLVALFGASQVLAFGTTVNPNGPFPNKSEDGQYGTNNCGTKDSKSAKCQTLIANSASDFCLWAPPSKATVGDDERVMVSYCTQTGHGSRLIPKGAITSSHFVQTPHYLQITGYGDFTKMNIISGDEGGELDPHGADGNGAIVIATVNGKKTQITEWTQFISYNQFCIRMCIPGPDAARYCEHIYDTLGCFWNLPGEYGSGFTSCKGKDVAMPNLKNGGTSTFYQGQKPTPSAQKAPASSSCTNISSLGGKASTSKAKKSTRNY
ncbi:hypothetical protein RQP46_008509 [Phenoliferia psychrophenolica]